MLKNQPIFQPANWFIIRSKIKKRLLLILFIVLDSLASVHCSAIDSSCKCVLFNSTFGKDYGIFHSPDWPSPYQDDINCLLYTFQGNNDQIVEITFDEFDLQKANLE